LMYCDGANMNALLGTTMSAEQGFDMIHLNLHKTFSAPHGGGGPGAGALGVRSFLSRYLPAPRIVRRQISANLENVHTDTIEQRTLGTDPSEIDNCGLNLERLFQEETEHKLCYSDCTAQDTDEKKHTGSPVKPKYIYEFDHKADEHSVGKLKCFYGNFGTILRAYSYIRAWGSDIKNVSEGAILNANYLLSLLSNVYEVPYKRPCAHEFVLTTKRFGPRSALAIAKRLLDYGYHPPTIYFPLIVREALMIEPTETESKQTLDEFADTLIRIARELETNPDLVTGAPHTTYVTRLDEVSASRNPKLRWEPHSE
jgi:glycine dehydrogenase subunit 2